MSELGTFVLLYRDLFDHWISDQSREKGFHEAEAWIWLIFKANHRERSRKVNGHRYPLKRGDLTTSMRFLKDAWNWSSTSVVKTFLDELAEDGMISINKEHPQMIITICKYDTYQGRSVEKRTRTERTENGERTRTERAENGERTRTERTENGERTRTERAENKYKEGKEEKNYKEGKEEEEEGFFTAAAIQNFDESILRIPAMQAFFEDDTIEVSGYDPAALRIRKKAFCQFLMGEKSIPELKAKGGFINHFENWIKTRPKEAQAAEIDWDDC